MGIKNLVRIGLGLIAIGGIMVYRQKKVDERYKRAITRVDEIDQKDKQEIEADMMSQEVDKAIYDMGLSPDDILEAVRNERSDH